jgi:predicted GNAT family acetyltransferase
MDLTVVDAPAARRYEARFGEDVAGFTEYTLDGDRIIFTHTEVDKAYEGEGIGGALARGALDDARARGLAVVPRCPFIRGWIARHPDYADLVRAS